MKPKFCLALSVMTLLPFSVASGATLYDNGSFNSLGGNGMGDALQSEDFNLSSASNLTAIRFWSMEAPGAYLGSVAWSVRSSVANAPGGTIASGTATPTTTNVGSGLGLDIIQYDFNVTINNLAANTYWLVLHDGPVSSPDFQDMYWAYTNLNGTNTGTVRGLEQNLPGGVTWNDTGQEHAFVIFGDAATGPAIPEPASFVLISTGLAGVWFIRRKSAR